MSTKLNRESIDKMKRELAVLLNCGLRYTKLNMTNEEMGEFWHAGLPDELLDAYSVLAKHGVGIEYHAVSSSVGFALPIDSNTAYTVRLTVPGNNGGFINYTREMAKNLPKCSLDAGGTVAEDWPVIDSIECIRRMGQARFDEFLAWAIAADAMSREVATALSVVDEILGMVKTAGQLARMVPDMVNYLSTEMQQEVASQKRASQLPYEWAAYPRDKVDAAMTTLAKCHLIKGLVGEDSKHVTFGGDSFSWAVKRAIVQPKAVV